MGMQACSAAAGAWRIAIMPLDTVKTTFQVAGADAGAARLKERLASQGPSALYEGALATSAATFVGHYPWFATYNGLSAAVAQVRMPGGDCGWACMDMCPWCCEDPTHRDAMHHGLGPF